MLWCKEEGGGWRDRWWDRCCGSGKGRLNGGMEAVMEEGGIPAGRMRESRVGGWRTDSHN